MNCLNHRRGYADGDVVDSLRLHSPGDGKARRSMLAGMGMAVVVVVVAVLKMEEGLRRACELRLC